MTPENIATPRERISNVIGNLWWLIVLKGILLLILGGYALFHPGMSVLALTQVIAIFIVTDGILGIVAAMIGETPSRGWTAVRGVLEILVGIFVFFHSAIVAGITANVVMYVIAFSAILSGVLEIMAAIRDRKEIEGEGWMILGGVLAIVFGLILLASPLAFGMLLVRILGAYAIIYGVSLIVLSFRVRSLGKELKQ